MLLRTGETGGSPPPPLGTFQLFFHCRLPLLINLYNFIKSSKYEYLPIFRTDDMRIFDYLSLFEKKTNSTDIRDIGQIRIITLLFAVMRQFFRFTRLFVRGFLPIFVDSNLCTCTFKNPSIQRSCWYVPWSFSWLKSIILNTFLSEISTVNAISITKLTRRKSGRLRETSNAINIYRDTWYFIMRGGGSPEGSN